LNNPFREHSNYNCFGCSPSNNLGLKMEFHADGDEVVSTWSPGEAFEGWHDVLHGGIQATLIDEIASWVILTQLETVGVTYQLNTKYRSPVNISKGSITLRAHLVEQKRRIATIRVELQDGEGKLCTEGMVDYFVAGKEIAAELYHYPGREAFFKQ